MSNLINKKVRRNSIKRADDSYRRTAASRQDGFTLTEAMIAMVILLVSLLGVFATFTYSVNYNTGNKARSQALAVLQQKVELLRAAKFTPSITDSTLTGGTKPPELIVLSDGNRFRSQVTVDDDPSTAGIQIDTNKTIKEITITVTLDSPALGWRSAVPATVVLRRVRAN